MPASIRLSTIGFTRSALVMNTEPSHMASGPSSRGAGGDDLRAGQRTGFDPPAPVVHHLEAARHVAGAGDAVDYEQGHQQVAVFRHGVHPPYLGVVGVGVHIPQAGDDVSAGGVEEGDIPHRQRSGGGNLGDAAVEEEQVFDTGQEWDFVL